MQNFGVTNKEHYGNAKNEEEMCEFEMHLKNYFVCVLILVTT